MNVESKLIPLTKIESRETTGGGNPLKLIPVIGSWLTAIVAIGTAIDEIATGFNKAASEDCDGLWEEDKCN